MHLDCATFSFLLFGPLSSASPDGPGLIFSWFFIIVGGWVLIRSWLFYLKKRTEVSLPIVNLIGLSAIALLFIIVGIRGVLR
jgi:hypothetical protein